MRWFIRAATGMSKKQYVLICALSALCLILAIEEQRLAEESRFWQNQAAFLQARMDGSLRNRLGPQKVDALFQDLLNTSQKNSRVREWLATQGVTVKDALPPGTNSPAPVAGKPLP
jgi:hypothetical protein